MSYNPLTFIDINFPTEMQKGQIHIYGLPFLTQITWNCLLNEIKTSWIMSTYWYLFKFQPSVTKSSIRWDHRGWCNHLIWSKAHFHKLLLEIKMRTLALIEGKYQHDRLYFSAWESFPFTVQFSFFTNAATASPISSGESSCRKCRPLTVTSSWLGQVLQKSRALPVRIDPGSALTNNFGISDVDNHLP